MDDFRVRYYYLTIKGLEGERFVVAKLRRISSPPVQMGSVQDSLSSALGRLVDIIRLGNDSQNYADLKRIEWLLREHFGVTAEDEWAAYQQATGVDRLEPFIFPTATWFAEQPASEQQVTFHEGTMNDLPYLIARTGRILGSPAPIFLTWPHSEQSALLRLADVFRIGQQGQVFRDFVEEGMKLGKIGADSYAEWLACERAALMYQGL